MGSYDRDRVPPVFMDHGSRDYGMDLTYTERYFESLEEPPSRRRLEEALGGQGPKGLPGEDARVSPDRLKSDCSNPASLRAASLTAPSGLTDLSPTSDRRAGSSSLPLPAPNPEGDR